MLLCGFYFEPNWYDLSLLLRVQKVITFHKVSHYTVGLYRGFFSLVFMETGYF